MSSLEGPRASTPTAPANEREASLTSPLELFNAQFPQRQELFEPQRSPQNLPKPLDLEQVLRYGAHSVLVTNLSTGEVELDHRADERPVSTASVIKLAISAALIKREEQQPLSDRIPVPDSVRDPNDPFNSRIQNGTVSTQEALIEMLRSSSNTATNALVKYLGGPGEPINQQLRALGLSNTQFNNYLSTGYILSNQHNASNATDSARALELSLRDPTAVRALAQAPNEFGYPAHNREGDKIGLNSRVVGTAGVFTINRQGADEPERYSIVTFVERRLPNGLTMSENDSIRVVGETVKEVLRQLERRS